MTKKIYLEPLKSALCPSTLHVSLHSSFLFMRMGKRWRKVMCVMKSKVIQPQPKYKIQNQKFSKFKEKINQALIEVENKWEFEGATWSDYKRHKHG